MKKVTCREMGGVCDAEITGETAEEIAQKGYEHIEQAQDEEHKKVKEMIDSSTDEEKAKWMEEFQQKVDNAPEVE